MGSLFSSSGNQQAAQQQQQEQWQQQILGKVDNKITNEFAGYNPNFYTKEYNDLVASQEPQVQQQFATAGKNLGFKLANQGLGKSSQAKQLGESLTSANATAQENIANQANSQVNTLKQNVNQAEGNLISEANVANNPGQVAQQGLQVASGFQSPLSAQPVGDLFQNWANQYLAGSQNSGINAGNAGQGLAQYGGIPASSASSGGYGSSFMQPVSGQQ